MKQKSPLITLNLIHRRPGIHTYPHMHRLTNDAMPGLHAFPSPPWDQLEAVVCNQDHLHQISRSFLALVHLCLQDARRCACTSLTRCDVRHLCQLHPPIIREIAKCSQNLACIQYKYSRSFPQQEGCKPPSNGRSRHCFVTVEGARRRVECERCNYHT